MYYSPLQVRSQFNTKSGPKTFVQDKARISDLTLPELWHGITELSLAQINDQGGFVRASVLGYHRAHPQPHVEVREADWKKLAL